MEVLANVDISVERMQEIVAQENAVLAWGVRKQRARLRIGDPSASLVFIELTLQRAHQHAAFCAVFENHPQPGIGPSLGACEDLPSHG